MKRIHGLYAALLFFSLPIFAATEGPQKLKVQFEVTVERPHISEQINSNAILIPGQDWQTMSSDRSLIIQGKLQPMDAQNGLFEFQILDAETKKVLSQSRVAGTYGHEAAVRNEAKDKSGKTVSNFEVKIKPTVVVE